MYHTSLSEIAKSFFLPGAQLAGRPAASMDKQTYHMRSLGEFMIRVLLTILARLFNAIQHCLMIATNLQRRRFSICQWSPATRIPIQY